MFFVLLITVGGSPQPIITAFQALQPDRVIFICSSGSRGSICQITGKGTPCEIRRGAEVVSKLPNVPTQLGLGDRFNSDTGIVPLENPDDLAECYRLISAKVGEIRNIDSSANIQVDYISGCPIYPK